MTIAGLGGGSWLHGALILLFCIIGFFNIGIGVLLTIEKMAKTFRSRFGLWLWIYLIVCALCFVAIKELATYMAIS